MIWMLSNFLLLIFDTKNKYEKQIALCAIYFYVPYLSEEDLILSSLTDQLMDLAPKSSHTQSFVAAFADP